LEKEVLTMKNINEFEKEHPELVDRLGDTILLWLS
jgi:hypothetical protein